MVAIFTGQETIPGQFGQPVTLTAEQVGTLTQQGFGLSPEESLVFQQEQIQSRAIDAERQRLADVERAGRQAGEEFYAEGGAGYGTVPGGPDVTYWQAGTPETAKWIYGGLDPYYGEGGIFEPVTDLITGEGGARQNLLLYGALAIGALALLKK